MNDWLEQLIAHEASYFSFGATCEKTPTAWFLDGAEVPDYRELNRALRLRDDGRGPEAVALEVVTHHRMRNLSITADVDPVAEAQGIGRALRRMGVTPVIGSRLLMRLSNAISPCSVESGIEIEIVPNDTGMDEARLWVETTLCDEEDEEFTPILQRVAELEARSPACRLYLARIEGKVVGGCDLFSGNGWGRIDSVMTCPEYRRRGVATRLVTRASAASLTMGNEVTYLYTDEGGAGEQVYLRLGFTTWARDILRRHIG